MFPPPVNILLTQFDKIVCLELEVTSNCARFWADTIVPILYFLYIVNIGSVALQIKSGNSSIYKKFGTLDFSVPGLLKTAFCIEIKKNNPNALWPDAPKSPRLVHTNVISPFANILSKSILLCLLHKIDFTPGILNNLSNWVIAASI